MRYRRFIPGVGNVEIDGGFWSIAIYANGAKATRRGRIVTLPTADGGVTEAQLGNSFVNVYPSLTIADTRYPFGNEPHMGLKFVAALPFLLIPIGAALGGLIGAIAVIVVNRAILLREQWPAGAQVAAMTGVAVLAFLIYLALAGLLHSLF